LGILIVHVAFETSIDAKDVELLHGPVSSEVEFSTPPDAGNVEPTTTLGAGCVMFDKVSGPRDPSDPAPVDCTYPFPWDVVPSMSTEKDGLEDNGVSERLVMVVTVAWVIKAVMLEYGA
jgi:hypothetical protein